MLGEEKEAAVEKAEAEVLLLPHDRVGTGLLQRVILLEADAGTLPQKGNKAGRAVVREA